ncbi:MAG: PD-(D/E)XK nuclease family protein [Myxococcota bacterium]
MMQPNTLHVVSSQASAQRLLLDGGSGGSKKIVWTARRFFGYLRMLGVGLSQEVLCERSTTHLAVLARWFADDKTQYSNRVAHSAHLLQLLHNSDVQPQHLCKQFAMLPPQQQGGLLPKLQQLQHAQYLLDKAGLCDASTAWWRCLRQLQQANRLPAALQTFTEVVFDHVVDLSALQWQLLCQLARLGLHIQVHLPDWQQIAFFADTVAQIKHYLHAQADTDRLRVVAVAPTSKQASRLHLLSGAAKLQSCPAAVCKQSHIQLQAAANPQQEAHWIAQRIVAWQRQHASPVRIAIALPQRTQQAHALQQVLHEYGIRCVLLHGLPLLHSRCMQLLLLLLQARQQGVAAHTLCALLAHPSYRARIDTQQASQLQEILMQTGVQTDTDPTHNTAGAFLRYLKQHAQSHTDLLLPSVGLEQATAHLEPLLNIVYAIPQQGRLQLYLQHMMQLLQQHMLPCQEGGYDETQQLLKELLHGWNLLMQHDKAADAHELTLADFTTWLQAQAQQHYLAAKPVTDSGLVQIVTTKQLWARQVDYVVVTGLQQHSDVASRAGSAVLNGQDLSALCSVLDQEAAALLRNTSQLADPAAFGRLWFAGAILAAQHEVLISTSVHDQQGRSVLPSLLFSRLCVACDKPLHELSDPNQRPNKPLSQLQYQHAAAQHALRQQENTQHHPITNAHAASQQSVPCLSNSQLQQTHLFARMQQQRHAFFANEATAAAFAFSMGTNHLLDHFGQLGLHPGSPLTPSRIEALASCPFRFFIERLLKAHLPKQADSLPPHETGQLAHDVLRRFYEQHGSRMASLQPQAIQQIVQQLVHSCSKPWLQRAYEHEQPLWQGFCLWLQTAISQLLVRQQQHPPIAAVTTKHVELAIGLSEGSQLAPVPICLHDANNKTIFLAGVLDRVDFGADRCVVVDYKMGSQTQLSAKMSPSSLLQSHFQLPIYQRLLSHHFPQQTQGQLLGYLLSIRDGKPSSVLGGHRHPHWRQRVQQDQRTDSLAAALQQVLQPIYNGHVPAHVGPACEHCCLQHVCRKPVG